MAVVSVFVNFMAIVFFRFLDLVLAFAPSIVGGCPGRGRDHSAATSTKVKIAVPNFRRSICDPPQNHTPCSTFSDWIEWLGVAPALQGPSCRASSGLESACGDHRFKNPGATG